jgi:hypothetical protein
MPRVRTFTMPHCGLDLDSRFSRTSDSEYSVSPANKGWGNSIWSQPSAKPFSLTSATPIPATIASVSALLISGRPYSVRLAYSVLKWIWLVLLVSSVNHVLSASVNVRPKRQR